jgi:hypothetical protein
MGDYVQALEVKETTQKKNRTHAPDDTDHSVWALVDFYII